MRKERPLSKQSEGSILGMKTDFDKILEDWDMQL